MYTTYLYKYVCIKYDLHMVGKSNAKLLKVLCSVNILFNTKHGKLIMLFPHQMCHSWLFILKRPQSEYSLPHCSSPHWKPKTCPKYTNSTCI